MKTSLVRTIGLFFTCMALISLTGCSVYMAANQPPKKNIAVLKPGTPRDLVVAEIGAPVTSEITTDGRKDIYTFVQGYGKLAKSSRAFFHGAADLFTIGLWEAVGTPVESAFDGKKISVRVLFDRDDRVAESDTLSIEDPKNPEASAKRAMQMETPDPVVTPTKYQGE